MKFLSDQKMDYLISTWVACMHRMQIWHLKMQEMFRPEEVKV